MSDENFLARWSRRKVEARKGDEAGDPGAIPDDVTPTQAATASQAVTPEKPGAQSPEPLPPLESLTPRSDFAPFMREGVDPALKGQALKTLFSDASLYPMDGLDVYIDDYSKPDPLPAGWLEKLNQYAALDSHNQPERDAEAARAPVSPPPTESVAPSLAAVPEPTSVAPPDASGTPTALPDAPDQRLD